MKHQKILIVAPSPAMAFELSSWVSAHYDVLTVATYDAAKAELECAPDAVLTPVKLGDFNGLQLIIHAQALSIPAVVIDVDDPVLQRDATQLGATFLPSNDVTRERVLQTLETVCAPADEGQAATGISWVTFGEVPARPASPTIRRSLLN